MLKIEQFIEKLKAIESLNVERLNIYQQVESAIVKSFINHAELFLSINEKNLLSCEEHERNYQFLLIRLFTTCSSSEALQEAVNELEDFSLSPWAFKLSHLVSNMMPSVFGVYASSKVAGFQLEHANHLRALIQEAAGTRHPALFTNNTELLLELEDVFATNVEERPQHEMIPAYKDIYTCRLLAAQVLNSNAWRELFVDLNDEHNYLYPFREGQYKHFAELLSAAWEQLLFNEDQQPEMQSLLNMLVQFFLVLKNQAAIVNVDLRFFTSQSSFYVALAKKLQFIPFPANFMNLKHFAVDVNQDVDANIIRFE